MKTLRKLTLVMLLLAAVLMAGCKKDEFDYNNNPEPSQDTPNGEMYYADYECLYTVINDDADGYYALAKGVDTDYLLHLNSNGSVTNQSRLGFQSRRCILETSEYLVVIGASQELSTPYSMNMYGWVAAFDRSLNLVSLLKVAEEEYLVDLYSIVQDPEDATLFYAGGFVNVEINGVYQQKPYICSLRFDGSYFSMIASRVFSQYDNSRIIGLLIKQQNGQKDLIAEMLHYETQNAPFDWNNTLHFRKLNFFNEQSGWGSDTWHIMLDEFYDMKYYSGEDYVSNNGFDSDDNNIYVFGRVFDEKDFTPQSGGHWRSGCVVAINWHDGQIQWTQKLRASDRDDDFYNGKLIDGYLYICGRHSGVYFSDIDRFLGNGLLVKYSVSGTLISYKTFGQSDRYSWLIKPIKNRSGEIVCVGVSGESVGKGGQNYFGSYSGRFYGWFLKTDMSSGGSSKAISADIKDEWFEDLDAESTGIPM